MRATVFLFDIDGTLLSTSGAGRRALQRAFEARHGRPDAIEQMRLDGMTDPAIVRQALGAIGVPYSAEALDALLETYLLLLAEEVERVPVEQYRVHLGAREAVEALALRAKGGEPIALGLGTGNVRDGARIKLGRVGLDRHFAFGGFGCDAELRAELLRKGAERGAASLGREVESCRVVVIGDTPKDVAAAHAIGAECVGVGTGHFTPDALIASGARWAFPHLGVHGALDALLPDGR